MNTPSDVTDKQACGSDLPPLRSPDEVMTLERLGASFPHRLSFMRSFIRNIAAQKVQITSPSSELDQNGFGHLVLSLKLSGYDYSLIAFSRPLDDADRTDRVIATKWDASFCLFDGIPSQTDIDTLSDEVTRQEAGRYHDKVLTLSRANKSVRLFQHVIDELSDGRQPDWQAIISTGYLMRTTAVYGNGKFGIADRAQIESREGLGGPFQVEMLTVYLIREFTLYLADFCAAQKGGDRAVRLEPARRRYLGIGNSTGLGMAPFLVTHPVLLNSWIMAREVALARVRAIPRAHHDDIIRFGTLLNRAHQHCCEWVVDDKIQMQRIKTLRTELEGLKAGLIASPLRDDFPFEEAFFRTSECSHETQELMASVLIELFPDIVDGLADCMATPVQPRLFPSMTLSVLSDILSEHYGWVDDVDVQSRTSDAQFWYTSEDKLEPRMGSRYDEPGAEREMPFNIAAYVNRLRADMQNADDALSVAEFLMRFPQHRFIIRRVQTTARFPYAEIRDNLVGADCRAVDLLRCKLSFFGASKFDPKSDKWTRITLYQGAPTAADLASDTAERLDDWSFARHQAG